MNMEFKFSSCPAMVGIGEEVEETPSEESAKTKLHNLPVEIHNKILRLLDPIDVLSYARTCKAFHKYSDNQHLW